MHKKMVLILLSTGHCKLSRRRKDDMSMLWMQCKTLHLVLCCQSIQVQVTRESDLNLGNTQKNYYQHGMSKDTLHFFLGTDVHH